MLAWIAPALHFIQAMLAASRSTSARRPEICPCGDRVSHLSLLGAKQR
ncbi:hypothetical protein WME90_24265 [Sorangium sp. So ce375]